VTGAATSDNPAAAAAGDPPDAAPVVFGTRLPLALRYADRLANAGTQRGLLGPRESTRLWERHLLNCAVLTDLIPTGARVVDVGSGAGLPGVPMAIRRPDLTVDLVEPMLRRSTFLAEVVHELGLGDTVRVVRGRAEEPDTIRAVGDAQWAVARALAPLDRLAGWCLPLLAPGGTLLALKGRTVSDEVAQHRSTLRRLGGGSIRVEVVGSPDTAEAHVVLVTRSGRPR
jgi:16S rRNA (guanine527-N7)-methyltransferase